MSHAENAQSISRWVGTTRSPIRARPPAVVRLWKGLGPLGLLGLIAILIILPVAALAPLIAPHDPLAFVGGKLQEPSGEFWFGTDNFGRDLFSRVIIGARASLIFPITVLGAAVVLGMLIGASAAMLGGRIDELLMRVTDLFFAFPYLVVALAIGAALQPSVKSTVLALTIVWWPTYARLVRAQTLRMRALLYVEAARSIGASEWEIVRRHFVPQYVNILLIKVTMDFGSVIGISAGLSFIGLGAQPPTAEWGLLIAESTSFALSAWWTAFFPGAAMFITILAFAMLGDTLVDWLDPTVGRK